LITATSSTEDSAPPLPLTADAVYDERVEAPREMVSVAALSVEDVYGDLIMKDDGKLIRSPAAGSSLSYFGK
jgi:hypothetical protein